MKQLIKTYTINASSKTITLTDYTTVLLERLYLITDVTTQTILYQFNTTPGVTVSGNVLTFTTLAVTNTDKLQIIYDSQTGDPLYDTLALPTGAATATNQTNGTQQTKLTDGTNTVNILKSDGTAAGQNAQMTAGTYFSSSFSVTAAGATTAIDAGNYRSVSVQIASTYTTTISTTSNTSFQGSNDGTTWGPVSLQVASSGLSAITSSSGTGIFAGSLPTRYFRLNITGSYSTGTEAGTIVLSTLPLSPVSNPNVVAVQSGTYITTTNASTAGSGTSSYQLISAASTNATTVKAAAATLFGVQVFNTTSTVAFLKLYNKATAPTVGTDTPVKVIQVPVNSGITYTATVLGVAYSAGLSFAITGLVATSDTTAVAASAIVVNLDYV